MGQKTKRTAVLITLFAGAISAFVVYIYMQPLGSAAANTPEISAPLK